MLKLFIDFWGVLELRRKSQFLFLACSMVIAGLFEMLSLGAFAPLVAMLAAPENTNNFAFFKTSPLLKLFNVFPVGGSSLLSALAVKFAILVVLSGLMRVFVVWANARFTAALGTDISSSVYDSCLNLSYSEYLNRGAGELVSMVRDKAGHVGVVLYFLLNLFSSLLIALMICAGLFFLNPWFTAGTIFLLGGFYGMIGWGCRQKLLENSRVVAEESTRAVKAVQEGFGSIRDVILDASQTFYVELFRRAEGMVQKASARGIFLASAPRYLTETFAMVIFAGVLIIFIGGRSGNVDGTNAVLPALGILALGAQRVMPLIQQIYNSWAVVSGSSVTLRLVLESVSKKRPKTPALSTGAVRLGTAIKLKDLSFKYREDLPWVIYNFNLTIRRGSCIGIKGETGCGKSTLVDLIIGLLRPNEGFIEVDGIKITTKNVSSWQKNIAHVPQSIFLADVSIAENIALGTSHSKIEMREVRKAAQNACIADFIESTKQGYKTTVGERGVRLSGGQRQRIGIARALYRNPELLILDEATSALDEETEKAVMDSILASKQKQTLILIAHRLSTLKHCDNIISLAKN